MSKIRVIIKRPDERYGHVTNISHTLENLQKTVEGHIETVTVAADTVMICNEEGKILDLPKNFRMGMWPFSDVIRGTVIIAGVDGEDFCDVPLSFTNWKLLLKTWGND